MTIDLACLAFCLLYALFGYFTGGLIQLLKIAALVASVLIAVWSAPIVAALIRDYVGVDLVLAKMGATVLVWIVLYITLSIAGRIFIKGLHEASETVTAADRKLGALLGLFKALVLVAVLVFLLGTVKDYIYRYRPESVKYIEDSRVVSVLSRLGAAEHLLPGEILDAFRVVKGLSGKKKEEIRKELEKTGNPLLKNKAMREVLADSLLMEQIREGKLLEIMKNPKFRRLASDPEFHRLLAGMSLSGKTPETSAPDSPKPSPKTKK